MSERDGRKTTDDMWSAFERAYRTAWDVRRFTGSRDPRPLVRALEVEGLGSWVHDGKPSAALGLAWRAGVSSPAAAWRAARLLR